MASKNTSRRGVVLVEDKRQERFIRELLKHRGWDPRGFRFYVAPDGRGAAEAWVRKRYPGEVKVLRSKSYQKNLCLVAMRDGDNVGVTGRKRELDDELVADGQNRRGDTEPIATPVPTWSIETWLLFLQGERGLTEDTSYKTAFPSTTKSEGQAIQEAAGAWPGPEAADRLLPSLADGRDEIERLSP